MEALGTVNLACDEATERLSRELRELGLDVVRSFDLQSARRALRDPEGCPCPSHGTVDCPCQYVVLLVHANDEAPMSLVLHGHGGETLLSMNGPTETHAAAMVRESVRIAVGNLASISAAQG